MIPNSMDVLYSMIPNSMDDPELVLFLGLPVDLDQLVDAAEGGLALAGHQVSPDPEAGNLVTLEAKIIKEERRKVVFLLTLFEKGASLCGLLCTQTKPAPL
jgi:hypothetical protein